jgi:ABC-2 type transport system permease protein
MRPIVKLTVAETRLFLREPAALFFTLALPLILLAINGTGGNEPNPRFGGAGPIDILVPGYIAMSLATLGLTALPEILASYRERGVLRRLGATPLPAGAVLGAHVVVQLVVGLASVVLLVGVGAALFGLRAPVNPYVAALAFVAGALAMVACGMLLAAVLPSSRTAIAVGLGLYLPMIFMSGAAIPREALPDAIRNIGELLPLGFVVDALRDAWTGGAVDALTIGALAAIIVVAGGVAVRSFRWE